MKLQLNVFDARGNVVDSVERDLLVDQIQDIIDHAAQLVIISRKYGEIDGVLAELDSALFASNVIDELPDVLG